MFSVAKRCSRCNASVSRMSSLVRFGGTEFGVAKPWVILLSFTAQDWGGAASRYASALPAILVKV